MAVSNLLPAGEIKQGDTVGVFNLPNNNTLSIKLIQANGALYAFVKNSALQETTFRPLTKEGLEANYSSFDFGAITSVVKLAALGWGEFAKLTSASINTDQTPVIDNTKGTGFYTDGAGAVQNTPFKATSTLDGLKTALGSATDAPITHWYQTPWKVGAAIFGTVVGFFGIKWAVEKLM